MKRYDENFKIAALKLSDEIGVKKACEQLSVDYGTLAGWRKQRVNPQKISETGKWHTQQRYDSARTCKD